MQATDQPIGSLNTSRMCSRWASARVREADADGCFVTCFRSVNGRRNTDPGKYHCALYEILRILPGQA